MGAREKGRRGRGEAGRREREEAEEPARERTFVIAARVTRCPRSVATPPDARQSSVRRATVVSKLTGFSSRPHFALVLRPGSIRVPFPAAPFLRAAFAAFAVCSLRFSTLRPESTSTLLPPTNAGQAPLFPSFCILLDTCHSLLSLSCLSSWHGHEQTVSTFERHSPHVDRAELSPCRRRQGLQWLL